MMKIREEAQNIQEKLIIPEDSKAFYCRRYAIMHHGVSV